MELVDYLKMSKPFSNDRHKAHLNLAVTTSLLHAEIEHVLRPLDLTTPQFNILRILRGKHPNMVSVKTITERMIDKTSNTSRLIDKLMSKHYVTRIECPKDRRKVDISITENGLKILLEASSLVEHAIGHSLNAISDKDITELNRILDLIRNATQSV